MSISCFSFSHTFHSCLLKASSEQVSIIIAVSVAFGFYELRAVCAVFRAQVRRVDPLHTKSQAASFRKVNILQSIVWSYFAVSHAASFSCFVWLWGSLAGAQSVSWILIDSIKLTSFGLENLKQSGQIWKWAKLPCMARQNVLLGQKCKRGFTVSNVVKSRAIICLWICVSINSTL